MKSLQKSLTLVQDWMFTNKLKLNPNRTEFMLIGNKLHRNKFDSKFPVDILNNLIPPVAHAKNLGIIIYSDLTIQRHIKILSMCATISSVTFAMSESISL